MGNLRIKLMETIVDQHKIPATAAAELYDWRDALLIAKAKEFQSIRFEYQAQLDAKDTALAELQQTHTTYVAKAEATIKKADAVIQDKNVDDPATLAELKTIVETLQLPEKQRQLQELDAQMAALQTQREALT